MFLSALNVVFVVPLGCLVGSFICLRKFYMILYQKTLVGFKRKSLLEKSKSATNDEDLRNYFGEYGTITSAVMMKRNSEIN